MKGLKHYYKFFCIITIVFLFNSNAKAQQDVIWTDIILLDSLNSSSGDFQNHRYPTSNLFDSDFSTCWVCGTNKNSKPSVFIKLPELNEWIINIFPGYGKDKNLFYQNSRPRKVSISVFIGINPSGGFVTEIATIYKSVEFPQKIETELSDSFGVQSIPLNFSKKELYDFKDKVDNYFTSTFNMTQNEQCFILMLEVLDIWQGTNYDDICISELFFNNSFITMQPIKKHQIKNVYINKNENALLIDDETSNGIVVFEDSEAVLQLIDVSANKKWAILITMPAVIEGRAETYYLLVDLVGKVIVNDQLEKYTGKYKSGNEMHFEINEIGQIELMFIAQDYEYHKIELK